MYTETSLGRIFARVGGKGPPLLLLHGFPQTHVMWHHLAPALAERFSLVIADLPGYGASDVPKTDASHTPYTKRAMARAMVEVMESLGHSRFSLAGHDRGGRVGYRLALDHQERLSQLIVLDILPTYNYWTNLSRLSALRIYHWTFLAQLHPMRGSFRCHSKSNPEVSCQLISELCHQRRRAKIGDTRISIDNHQQIRLGQNAAKHMNDTLDAVERKTVGIRPADADGRRPHSQSFNNIRS